MKKILIIVVLFSFFLIGCSNNNQKTQENINYCEIYAEQELTAMRIAIGGGEKQYSLNGTWVNESILFEDCKK